jgi:hypothetical protein
MMIASLSLVSFQVASQGCPQHSFQKQSIEDLQSTRCVSLGIPRHQKVPIVAHLRMALMRIVAQKEARLKQVAA